jgi:hypothetical protein
MARCRLVGLVGAAVARAERNLAPPAGPDGWFRLAGAVRIGLGAAVVHQQLNDLGFSPVTAADGGFAARALVQAGLGVAVGVGLFTPLALLGLLAAVPFYTNAYYLGSFVEVILAWGLLLGGAGRRYALDRVLARLPGVGAVVRGLDRAVGGVSAAGVARLRLVLLGLFWGICLSAASFHLDDRLWLDGRCLQVVLTNPFWCDHYQVFARLRAEHPGAFDLLLTAGLAGQAGWELSLVPLLVWRPTARLAALWGWAFFLASLFLLNLGYLPVFELLLWALLVVNLPADPAAAGRRWAGPPGGRITAFAAAAAAVALALQLTNPWWAKPVAPGWADRVWADRPPDGWYTRWFARRVCRAFGQGYVNVFNAGDARATGAQYLVVAEVGPGGGPARVVPFQDAGGGRLSYLRNDALYFRHALTWRREGGRAFDGGDIARPTPMTTGLYHRVADLDAALTHRPGPRRYVAYVFRRPLEEPADGPPGWGEPVFAGTLAEYTAADRRAALGPVRLPYKLPPGHAGQAARERQTLEVLRDLHRATARRADRAGK